MVLQLLAELTKHLVLTYSDWYAVTDIQGWRPEEEVLPAPSAMQYYLGAD